MVSGLGFRVLGLGQKTHNQYLDINYACALSPHVYIICGWLSKLWSLFGYPKYQVPYYNRDPKRDHNLDNHHCIYVLQL